MRKNVPPFLPFASRLNDASGIPRIYSSQEPSKREKHPPQRFPVRYRPFPEHVGAPISVDAPDEKRFCLWEKALTSLLFGPVKISAPLTAASLISMFCRRILLFQAQRMPRRLWSTGNMVFGLTSVNGVPARSVSP